MSVTVTFHLWWLGVYIAVGGALYPVLAWQARQSLQASDRRSYLATLLPGWRRWYIVPASVVLWPVAVWEQLR